MSSTAFQYEPFDAFSPYVDVGPYRADDYWRLPEGAPVELVRGRFVMSPSPNILHQTVVSLLLDRLLDAARKTGSLTVCAPMDVILSEDTILQPDLLYIAKDRCGIVKDRVEGPPDLVVEILSHGTDRRDRVEKLDLYARYGVSEYWIVDPLAQVIEFLINDGGRFVVTSAAENRYQSPHLPEVAIQLADFWQEVVTSLPKS